jgi:hypothetical protein
VAETAEVERSLASAARSGADADRPVTQQYLPDPPFPDHLTPRPIVVPITCTIDEAGRFRRVQVSTGDARWDRMLREFIERNWRADPARRGGRPVASVKKYELNYYAPGSR